MYQSQSSGVTTDQMQFEKSIDKSRKKDFGIYLTNNIQTVDKVLDVIDFKEDDLLNRKFLEPSCGNGVFVIRLLERIFYFNADETVVADFISTKIFFADIDNRMIEITQRNICRFFSMRFGNEYTGRFNSFVLDYTKKLKPDYPPPNDPDPEIQLADLLGRIDYVIGNPPYITLYGRRDRKQNENQRIYFLNNYSQFPDSLKNGKINYVMLFIEQSIDLLKPGGKLSFIVDLAFFETAYQHTRRYLLENTRILSIEYNIRDFEVASGQLILKIRKEKVDTNTVRIVDAATSRQFKAEQSTWNNQKDQYRFRFNTCAESAGIVEKIKSKNCPSLKELYPYKNLRTCVMLLSMESLFVFDTPGNEPGIKAYPYYQGSKGLKKKYAKLEYTKFFHFDKALQNSINDGLKEELTRKQVKNKKRLGLGETIIYDNPKLFIRQSAREIIASYDAEPGSANNSLYVFSLRDNSRQSVQYLKFMCGLLNSQIITFFCQQQKIIRYSVGKQPQIKISDLYTIPVPTDVNLQNAISSLVDEIIAGEKADERKHEIDELIYAYFNISECEKRTIEKAVATF